MITCPNCGASHYMEGPSQRTLMYFPPIWENGINKNKDMNVTTTKAHCCECNFDFEIKEQEGRVWTILKSYNPPPPTSDIDITARTDEYVPIENQTQTAVATINIDTGETMRQRYQWEIDIEQLQERVTKLQSDVIYLTGEIVKMNQRIGDLAGAMRAAVDALR